MIDWIREHEWQIIAAILLAVLTYQIYGHIRDRRIDKTAMPPAQEITRTDKAAETVQEKIVIYQQAQKQLPEVIQRAKQSAQSKVDSLDDGGVADAWNSRLGEYRQRKATAAGIPAD